MENKKKYFGGKISRLTDKGFGFISFPGSDKDLFFHANELQDTEYNELQEGDAFHFEIVETDKGFHAVNVQRNGYSHNDEPEYELEDELEDHASGEMASGVVSALKSFAQNLIAEIAKRPTALDEIEWRDLERLIAEAFSRLGFDVELTPGSKDGGKDVVLRYTESEQVREILIEIKHWSFNKVNGQIVSNFVHVVAREQAVGGLILSTSGFTKNATEFITEINHPMIGLGADNKIVRLCQNYMRAEPDFWIPSDELIHTVFDGTEILNKKLQ